ncbi:MAG: hypothetical protein H6950_08355 [Zoogloeaceae bacterium]|nr:hypothetical protein [Rhodocyclaceae bacterium]MCP5231768.1 hypothetical protein [Zoogloeaceae bacterium]MCP5240990.1 hypothetical protein [Zoogloeaceae bacterium]MCP5294692.1 hypothetical protein [Zoogloeaceae bacterium]
MKTKALDLRLLIAALMLTSGVVLFAWKPLAFAEGLANLAGSSSVVQDKTALSEAEVMMLVHRGQLPRAAGTGTAR